MFIAESTGSTFQLINSNNYGIIYVALTACQSVSVRWLQLWLAGTGWSVFTLCGCAGVHHLLSGGPSPKSLTLLSSWQLLFLLAESFCSPNADIDGNRKNPSLSFDVD